MGGPANRQLVSVHTRHADTAPRRFRAEICDASRNRLSSSAPVEVAVEAFTMAVKLEAARSSVTASEHIELTATAAGHVGGTPYHIAIIDDASGEVIASCWWASTCATAVRTTSMGERRFQPKSATAAKPSAHQQH